MMTVINVSRPDDSRATDDGCDWSHKYEICMRNQETMIEFMKYKRMAMATEIREISRKIYFDRRGGYFYNDLYYVELFAFDCIITGFPIDKKISTLTEIRPLERAIRFCMPSFVIFDLSKIS